MVSTNIKASFLANTTTLKQTHLDWLTKRHSVPPLALAYDGDGFGWPIGVSKVEKVGRRFQFRPEDGAGAFVVIARDDAGDVADLVAWEPKAGWTVPWLGEVPMLGMQDVLAQRDDDPLHVHRGMLEWLQDDRTGVVILVPGEARRILEGTTLRADDVGHGEDLRRLLSPPRPRIVVSASSNRQAA